MFVYQPVLFIIAVKTTPKHKNAFILAPGLARMNGFECIFECME